jgi:myo-inositol catabolism protein IolS
MKYRMLGNSSLEVSVVTLGCMTFTGDSNWGPQDEKDSVETVRAAYDAGITFYDTAEGYADGMTETLLGKALGADRKRVMIASKVSASNLTKEKLLASCEASLKRLGTDYLDLYQIHWPSREIPIEETMDALLRLKEQGKIREIGVSNYGVLDLDTVLTYNVVVSNQLAYNMLFRGIEYSVLPKCMENGIGVLTYSSLAQGLLSGKYKTANDFPVGRARTKIFSKNREGARHGLDGCEDLAFAAIDKIRSICADIGEDMADVALAWSLAQPGITSVIAGGRTAAQALQNAKGADITLASDVLSALNKATEAVKAHLGDDADPWAFGRIR